MRPAETFADSIKTPEVRYLELSAAERAEIYQTLVGRSRTWDHGQSGSLPGRSLARDVELTIEMQLSTSSPALKAILTTSMR